jgi:hypothetical protein
MSPLSLLLKLTPPPLPMGAGLTGLFVGGGANSSALLRAGQLVSFWDVGLTGLLCRGWG